MFYQPTYFNVLIYLGVLNQKQQEVVGKLREILSENTYESIELRDIGRAQS